MQLGHIKELLSYQRQKSYLIAASKQRVPLNLIRKLESIFVKFRIWKRLSKAKYEEKKAAKVIVKAKPNLKEIKNREKLEKSAGTISLATAAVLGSVGGWLLVTSYELQENADIGAAALDIDYQEYDEEKQRLRDTALLDGPYQGCCSRCRVWFLESC